MTNLLSHKTTNAMESKKGGFDDYYGFCSGHWGDYFSPMLEYNGQIVKGDGF